MNIKTNLLLLITLIISNLSLAQTVSCTVTTFTTPPCSGTATAYKVTLGANIIQQTAIDWSGYDVGIIIPSGIDLKLKQTTITMTQNSWVQILGTLTFQGNSASSSLIFGTVTVPSTDFGTATSNGGASSQGTVLPVDMVYFKAKNVGAGIDILWATASEINSESFKLYHSSDAIRYTLIDSVKAAGISHSIKNYKLQMNNPYIGVNHFKLVQTDIDGKFEEFYTSINSVEPNITDVYPNPFTDCINLNLTVRNNISKVSIFDIYGNQIYLNTFYESESIKINTQGFITGMYFLIVDDESYKLMKK